MPPKQLNRTVFELCWGFLAPTVTIPPTQGP